MAMEDPRDDPHVLASSRGLSEQPDDETSQPEKKRGRLRVQNVGGSLTFLLEIALLAWGVRQLRRVLARRRQNQSGDISGSLINSTPSRPVDTPHFVHLRPLAVRKLVELDPTPYLLIDVRYPQAVRIDPQPLDVAINIPETEVRACLQLPAADWENRFPAIKKPGRGNLLVFLSTRGKRAQRTAAAAADLGYNGCCVLKGGIQALRSTVSSGTSEGLQYLSRDAVATLLQKTDAVGEENGPASSAPHLIDVRRHDERALYGHIQGSLHVPVEEWPKALVMDSAGWEKIFHFPKLKCDDLVILHCRTSRRASWAAHLAHDVGLKRCFVYKQGVSGWKLDPMVLPYDSYELGDVAPDPVKFEVEKVNHEAAEQELRKLGLL